MADVILSLGGNTARNLTAAKVATEFPDAVVLVSSEGDPDGVASIYRALNVDMSRVFFDFKAWDTLTNFTLTQPWVLSHKPKKLYVVTDDFHMERSMRIGKITYLWKGVDVEERRHPSERQSEPEEWVKWDTLRSLWWRVTGKTIENDDRVSRMIGINQCKEEAIRLGLQVTG